MKYSNETILVFLLRNNISDNYLRAMNDDICEWIFPAFLKVNWHLEEVSLGTMANRKRFTLPFLSGFQN